jgi:hypothetical protein
MLEPLVISSIHIAESAPCQCCSVMIMEAEHGFDPGHVAAYGAKYGGRVGQEGQGVPKVVFGGISGLGWSSLLQIPPVKERKRSIPDNVEYEAQELEDPPRDVRLMFVRAGKT